MTRKFPAGCFIANIHYGKTGQLNASLYAPNDTLLISATLDYIQDALSKAEFVQEGNLKRMYTGFSEFFDYSNDSGVNNKFMRISSQGFYTWYEWYGERNMWKCFNDELMSDKQDLQEELEKAYQTWKRA